MNYLGIPEEISVAEIYQKEAALSPSMFRRVMIPTTNLLALRDFLDPSRPFDKGSEPGSVWYLRHSTHSLIRTKALQDHSYLIYPKGDSIVPINPHVFSDPQLSDGDILLSKDSNVGECAIVDGDRWRCHMFSGGIVRIHPISNPHYVFAFLKHPLFRTQLLAKVARGATITHAKALWLDCKIPFPSQPDADRVIAYVSALVKAIIDKEAAIRDRSEAIQIAIQTELMRGQKSRTFKFEYPCLNDVRALGRFDAKIYDAEYKSKIWLIENYEHGASTPGENDFIVTPGPSLEIKLLGVRIDSDSPKPGFYALIIPTNISLYGTMNRITYLGTRKELPLLRQGDIVFGEAGFHKGRSIVLLEGIDNCTTNAHGLYARRADGDIQKSIFFRCVFSWYRNSRLIDLMAVGGSGGHFSPEYFEYLRIPRFPEDKQAAVVSLYHNPAPAPRPEDSRDLDSFVNWHRRRNASLGVWELDREMKALCAALSEVQKHIIEGKTFRVPFDSVSSKPASGS